MIKRVSNSNRKVTHNQLKRLINRDLTSLNLENKKGGNIAILSPSFFISLAVLKKSTVVIQRE